VSSIPQPMGLQQTLRCSIQSLLWQSKEQYFTNRHLLQTNPQFFFNSASAPPSSTLPSLLPSLMLWSRVSLSSSK